LVSRDTSAASTRTLGEILDQLVTEAGREKPAPFAELVTAAGLDPARDFVGGSLREVDLRGEDLRGFDFSGADLTGADLRGANLSGVSFKDAIRTGALGLPESTPAWEAPCDIFESSEALTIVIALPGVEPDQIKVSLSAGVLIVSGERPLPREVRDARIHRL